MSILDVKDKIQKAKRFCSIDVFGNAGERDFKDICTGNRGAEIPELHICRYSQCHDLKPRYIDPYISPNVY